MSRERKESFSFAQNFQKLPNCPYFVCSSAFAFIYRTPSWNWNQSLCPILCAFLYLCILCSISILILVQFSLPDTKIAKVVKEREGVHSCSFWMTFILQSSALLKKKKLCSYRHKEKRRTFTATLLPSYLDTFSIFFLLVGSLVPESSSHNQK